MKRTPDAVSDGSRRAALRVAWVLVLAGACGANAATSLGQPPTSQLPTTPRVRAQPATLGGAARGPRNRMAAAAATAAAPRHPTPTSAAIRPLASNAPAMKRPAIKGPAMKGSAMKAPAVTHGTVGAPRRVQQGSASEKTHAPQNLMHRGVDSRENVGSTSTIRLSRRKSRA